MKVEKYYSLDKLKVCYRVHKCLWDEWKENETIQRGDFKLKRTLCGAGEIQMSVTIPKRITKDRETQFATMLLKIDEVVNKPSQRYVWVSIENRMLYTDNSNINVAQLLTKLRDEFRMIFNNVSQAEVALDTNFEISAAIFKVIRMHKDPILVMGKTIKDPDKTIEELTVEMKTSESGWKRAALRFKPDSASHQFYIYDKLKDISRHNKKYILKHLQTNSDVLYRAEVRFTTDTARQAAKHLKMDDERWMYERLLNPSNLQSTWSSGSKQYIRIKRDRRHIYDVLEYIEELGIINGVSFCQIPF